MRFKILLLGMFVLMIIMLSGLVSSEVVNQTTEEPIVTQANTATANTLIGWRISPITTIIVLNVYRNQTDAGSDNPNVVRIRDETNTVIGEANFSGLKADFGDGVTLLTGGNYSIVMTNTTDTWDTPRSTVTSTFPFTFDDMIVTASITNDGLDHMGSQDWWVLERVEYEASGIVTTLNSPLNNSNVIGGNINFNSSILSINISLSNATLYIWNSTDDLLGTQDQTISGIDITNETIFINETLDFGDFSWNVLGCGSNDTGSTICSFASSNFSFSVLGFEVDTEIFSAEALETDSEIFELNITVLEGILSVSSNLNYNTTLFTPVITNTTNTSYTLTATIDIPLVLGTGEEQNKSFFWEVTTFDGATSFQSNTTTEFQNVSRIHFQECDGTFTVQTLNFTAYDEQTSARIDPFYMAAEFDFWLGAGEVTRPLAFSNTSTSELSLCISPPHRDFFIDDTIEYNDVINSTTYNTRNFYFQNAIINNQSQDIFLFLLNVDDSTSFILKVQDTNLLPIVDSLITTQRLDVGTGNFTTVQISRTDDNGLTVGFFKTETVDYRFIITRNNITLLTTGSQKVVPETAPFTLTFTVGADEGAPWIRFEDLANLTKSLIFDTGSSIVSFTYEDISGQFISSRLLVISQNLSGVSPIICDVNSTLSSAILVCDTGNVSATYTASAFITRDSEVFLVEQIIFSIVTFALVAGLLGVFLAWFIILISGFAFKFNEIAGIVLMNITVIMVNIIGLVNFGFLFIFGMLGVSIIIIVLLNR